MKGTEKMSKRVVVAGGGASGLVAAIFAAWNGADVTVLEHKDAVGKKILMTGNGKCNITNMSDVQGKYYSSDSASLEKIYDTLVSFDAVETRDFFKKLGLHTKEKRDGCVYPVSEQASIVSYVLKSECDRLGVNMWTDCEVTEILPDKSGGKINVTQYIRGGRETGKGGKKSVIVSEKNEAIHYDKLILATGGKAAPSSGSDGSGYRLAKKLGHGIIEPLPALVQLRCYVPSEKDFFKEVSGVRSQAKITLFIDGETAAIEEGELQLTDYGISGIPVFQFSRIASRAVYEGKKCVAGINFLPYINIEAGANLSEYHHKVVVEFLAGMVHKKVASAICRQMKISEKMTLGQAGEKKVSECLALLSDYRVEVTEPNSFENAQVCCGGVPLGEVDGSFASRKCNDVYIVGELLDCDGICGGYNLQWAWATGAIAGRAASKT